MSYILEALQRSQAERELGRVPTLEGAALLAEARAAPPRAPWALVAVALAATAVLLALYAVLRPLDGASAPPPGADPRAQLAPAASQPRIAQMVTAAGQGAPASLARPPAARPAPGALPVDRVAGGIPGPAAVGAPGPLLSAGVPLVEAPPPKVGHRGPADLAGAAPRDAVAGPAPGARDDADALELELKRQFEADQAAAPDAELAPPQALRPDPGPTPVPQDLISAIDAFKHQVKGGQGQAKDKGKPTPQPVVAAGSVADPTQLRLTRDQQAALPTFLMNVHVFDVDPGQRFVLINGLKYQQGATTREGLTVDEIRVDGVVLAHQGHPFFVHR
ncbi:general secretion pathway protein GspB [uncultured Thiodictyon sp.]|uniref:general secretion pathway protein GspB n=1 Tax=uncultured Thiodictyon sp. TaxID=1846217 RepID=UPI0025F98F1B|nr:general secretion pathway protein GspB [uncultured Thiodictyon sp.]